jgi:hypothetical protein
MVGGQPVSAFAEVLILADYLRHGQYLRSKRKCSRPECTFTIDDILHDLQKTVERV